MTAITVSISGDTPAEVATRLRALADALAPRPTAAPPPATGNGGGLPAVPSSPAPRLCNVHATPLRFDEWGVQGRQAVPSMALSAGDGIDRLHNRMGELMTERELLDAVRQACRWSALLTFHAYDSRRSERGFPDLCICGPSGLLFRELKSERGRLSPDQREWLDKLRQAGSDADVWRPCDWPGRVLAKLAGIGGRCLPTTQRQAS